MSAVRCRPPALAAGWALAAVLGCAPITVKPTAAPDLPDDCWACAVQADQLSPRTRLILRRYDLADLADRDAVEAARRLHTYALQEPQPDALFALAELSFLHGRYAERRKEPGACDHYFRCAGYAYYYLM